MEVLQLSRETYVVDLPCFLVSAKAWFYPLSGLVRVRVDGRLRHTRVRSIGFSHGRTLCQVTPKASPHATSIIHNVTRRSD